MMTFLMEIDDKRGETDNSFHIKIQSYLSTVRLLSGLYQKLYKSNESERKTLEQLKGSLDILNQNMLRDHECSQTSHVTQSLTEIGDVSRSVSNEVKRPRKGKGLSGLERFSWKHSIINRKLYTFKKTIRFYKWTVPTRESRLLYKIPNETQLYIRCQTISENRSIQRTERGQTWTR